MTHFSYMSSMSLCLYISNIARMDFTIGVYGLERKAGSKESMAILATKEDGERRINRKMSEGREKGKRGY